jgi:nitroreductase
VAVTELTKPAAQAVLGAIAGRRSHPKLVPPAPSAEELGVLAHAAECAPDYMDLRPWRLVVAEGDDLTVLGDRFAEAVRVRKEAEGADGDVVVASMAKARSKFSRSPMVLAVICSPKEHRKVRWEDQLACAAAVCQNILLAATAMGYGSMWRTDHECSHPGVLDALGVADGELIAGLLHLGTVPEGSAKPPRPPEPSPRLTRWAPDGAAVAR